MFCMPSYRANGTDAGRGPNEVEDQSNMIVARKMALLQPKLHNMSPKPAKRLQQSLAMLEFNRLAKALPVKEHNLWVRGMHPLLYVSP